MPLLPSPVRMLVGLVINPVAGMGGPVGLKGTDGKDVYQEALRRGAVPVSVDRAMAALASIPPHLDVHFLTASGQMGEAALIRTGLPFRVVYDLPGETSPFETMETCAAFVREKVSLIVFCGGDGTAKDVLDEVGESVPIIGIPAGVKMHSGVFLNSPTGLGPLLEHLSSGDYRTELAEVADVDESAVRDGRISDRVHGYALTIRADGLTQPSKGETAGTDDGEEKEEIAQFFVEDMRADVTYIIGPGTTTKAIADRLGAEKTLLGVDVYSNRTLVRKDADEKDLMDLLETPVEAEIVVTPIGMQGFIFGRGNQPIGPDVIVKVGLDRIRIVATPSKLKTLTSLRVDTGDIELDVRLKGYRRVLVGYGRERLMKVE
jgi:predicted polyphosphate/ATP-dependent NAD kinase